MDCQHYVENMKIPDSKQYAKIAKQDVLSCELQSTFRDMTSKVNALAHTIRPDIMYATKYLCTRKGKATKSDMTQLMKVVKKIKQDSNRIIIPNLGEPEDWILAGIVDASHRTSGNLFSLGGHVVMLINKRNRAASTIHWESKKIGRVVHSSAAAETIALQMMFDTLMFVRKAVEQMCGQRAKGMQCVALTDNQGLFQTSTI